jgi:hypothetical protein
VERGQHAQAPPLGLLHDGRMLVPLGKLLPDAHHRHLYGSGQGGMAGDPPRWDTTRLGMRPYGQEAAAAGAAEGGGRTELREGLCQSHAEARGR